MKSSLKKLRGFALHKNDAKEKRDHQSSAQLDELAQASEDMQDMRNCYDSLLSAAAATENSAYEFSESLREMGSCLLEKTALNDDEDSGRVLLMLGKVQFELQKIVDSYRSHVFQTITTPSESLLNELRTVEEMKRQCDEKRKVYEYMIAAQREKGRSRSTKGESFSPQQLQTAHDEYDEEATLFVFRLKSLKQGQSRSLLTQAARHHAAQLDQDDVSFPQMSTMEVAQENLEKSQGDLHALSREPRAGSQSAPIFAEKILDPAERIRQTCPSTRKFHTYVLPTPVDAKSSMLAGSSGTVSPTRHTKLGGSTHNLWHSSPLVPKKHENDSIDDNCLGATVLKAQSVLKESNVNSTSIRLPPPLGGPLLRQLDTHTVSDAKKVKRQAFSGPIARPWSTKPPLSASGPIGSMEHPQLVSQMVLRVPMSQPSSSPKVSPSASPPLLTSPKISELHELPRPPVSSATNKIARPLSLIGHSAPLVSRGQEHSTTNKTPSVGSNSASPLPIPPPTVPRSFSIPSSSQRAMALHVAKLSEASQNPEKTEEVASPPLTPISLTNAQPASSASEVVTRAGQIRGGD